MISEWFRDFKANFWLAYRWLWRTKGVWLRALFCWAIGMAMITLDTGSTFDLRFQLRGAQQPDDRIVIVNLDEQEWSRWHGDSFNRLSPFGDLQAMTDVYYWHERTWQRLLYRILNDDPASVGVSLYFPVGTSLPDAIFQDPRVIWASRLDSDGRLLFPAQARPNGSNVGLIDFRTDEDRVVRRFASQHVRVPHMAVRLAKLMNREHLRDVPTGSLQTINFLGREGFFRSVSASEVLTGRLPKDFFRDRIVVIGSDEMDSHQFTTPLGGMSHAELIATVTHNLLDNGWIVPVPRWISALALLVILVLAVSILFAYPQAVALVFLLWLATGWTAVSLWVFDTFYIWLPILAPISQLLVTYVIFMGYQLTMKENLSWRLRQEKKYLTEVEQLKNNFVSLISHDLKTPIAKIQAICDRLMAQGLTPEVREGLTSLRRESSELHRYIQSILRISRVESSDFKINKEASDINELIFKASEQLKPLARDKNIDLELDLEPMFSVELDSLLIFEVILNLMENAIKYTPAFGKVRVTSQEVEEQVVVMVEDNGAGISQEDQARIFDKFYRGREHEKNTKGSGLGLFLVKYFIELHGGRVLLESTPGKGTKVGFRLPVLGLDNELEFSGVSA